MAIAGFSMLFGVAAGSVFLGSTQDDLVTETSAATEADNNRYLRFILPNGDWWTDSNVNTAVWGDGTYMPNNWQTKEDDFATYTQNNYNTVSVNGSTTMQYFQIYVSNNGTLSNLNGKTLYIKRLKGTNPDEYHNQATINYNSASGNTIKISGGSATNDGFYYKVRLKIQTSVGGSWNTHACYLYKSGNTLTLPVLGKDQCPENYKFDGWCTDSACATTPITSITPTADTVLYAKYSLGMYLIGDGVGGAKNWTSATAEPGAPSSNSVDIAHWSGISISSGAEFKVAQIANPSEVNYYGVTASGSAYVAENITRSGSNDRSNTNNFRCSVAGTYDIYLTKSFGIVFINEAKKTTYGYLYLPYTSSSNTNLKIVTYSAASGGGHECISGESLWTSVPTTISYTSIRFHGHYDGTGSTQRSGLVRIPIYDLRGLNSDAALSFKISLDGGSTWSNNNNPVNLPGTSDTPHIYYESTQGWSAVSYTMGTAARALFEIGDAIESAGTEGTLCAIDPEQAGVLEDLYDAVTDGLDSFEDFRGSHIYTYVQAGNSYSGGVVKDKTKTTVPITDIYAQLSNRASTGNWLTMVIPGANRNSDSPLTATLWIVLGAGLAGLAAIGTAYFVSKKKKHRA